MCAAYQQVGMSGVCYPDSLIASIPNLYYYAANNPSEATIAKRRSYANTISYLTPPAENAGLYKGLKVKGLFCLSYSLFVLPVPLVTWLPHGVWRTIPVHSLTFINWTAPAWAPERQL